MREFKLDPEIEELADVVSPDVILDGLNGPQKEAASHTDGPLLIIAGPGSGKTRVLTRRVAYVLATGQAHPGQILAVTFTNKAAREMRSRIETLVGEDTSRGIWMGTFHSIFGRVLRREADRLGFTSDFSIYDTDDQERVLRGLMDDYGIDPRQYSARSIRSAISSSKNQMIGPAEYARVAVTPLQERVSRIFQPYQDTLRKANAFDFDDLLLKPIELFEREPDVLERYRDRWRYIHIDEYQDTNRAQYTLAKMLAARHRNVCVVGDDAQSIYAFRGADIGNILSFQKDYPEATVIRLEQNYRSTKRILRLAESIIQKNQQRLEKTLWTDNADGPDIVLMEAVSERDEAQKIERRIRDLTVRGRSNRDFVVLYRTNAQSRSIEDALRRGGILYRVIGGISFYQRKEIKDLLAYLRLLVNPHDAASLRRVINYPTRGIGGKTIDRIAAFAADTGETLWTSLERVDEIGLPARARNAVVGFLEMMAGLASRLADPPESLARDVLHETGLVDEFRKEHTTENLVRWENVQELVSAIAEYSADNPGKATLSMFLQEIALYTDADDDKEDGNRVTLMTIHASKGLEFPVVFVTGLEEGLFPLMSGGQDADIEEERRLFYVGVTRAEEQVFLSAARSRFRFGEQQSCIKSRFLEECAPGLIATEAGGEFTGGRRRERIAVERRPHYLDMDPHYYRESLLQRQSPAQSGGERRIVYDEGEGGGLVPGALVEHDLFGEGKVLAMEGTGQQAKATVFFKEVGQKKLVLRFARLKVVG